MFESKRRRKGFKMKPIEDYKQIRSHSDLLSPFEKRLFVSTPRRKRLPLDSEDLSWNDFERLIARLIVHKNGLNLRDARLNGRQGQSQEGVDIIAHDPYDKVDDVFQCKHRRLIKRGNIRDWVRDFLVKTELKTTIRIYCFCTTFEIQSDKHLVDEWNKCQDLLVKRNIKPILWDRSKLEDIMRHAFDLVAIWCGPEVAKSFCVPELLLENAEESQYREQYAHTFENQVIIENVSVHCDLIFSKDSMAVSAIFTFSRADLKGISVQVSGGELVNWMRWSMRLDEQNQRPYARPSYQGNKFILQSRSICMMLTLEEVSHLDWVIRKAWEHVRQVAQQIENSWKIIRFRSVSHVDKNVYALIKIDRSIWRRMLDFAREYNFQKGNSEWHIFMISRSAIKVFVDSDTDKLDRGLHLDLWAYYDSRIAMPSDKYLTLGWSPMPYSDVNGSREYSPRKAWDAEYTHSWLLNSFVPKVLSWDHEQWVKSNASSKWAFWKSKPQKKLDTKDVDLSRWAYSMACCKSRQFIALNCKLQELQELVDLLQSHFNCSFNDIPPDVELIKGVLRSIDRLASCANLVNGDYIRGCLHLPDNLSISEGIQGVIKDNCIGQTRTYLDFVLRALGAALESANNVPVHEIDFVQNEIVHVWEQFREDLLSKLIT